MEQRFRMKLAILFIAIATSTCQNPDLCPFKCTCKGKAVTCKGLDSFPMGLLENTEELVFDVSSFDNNFQQNELKRFTSLKTLRVINSNFTIIHPCTISSMKKMSKLEFSNIQFGHIVSNGFSHLSEIEEISLVNITIQKLHKYAFNDIKNVNKLTMEEITIANMEDYAFNSWSNIRYVQLKALIVFTMKERPFEEFNFIDQFDIIKGLYPSSMCGMKDIIQNESVKKIRLHNNKINCNCNTLWVWEIRRNAKDIEIQNNNCSNSRKEVFSNDNKDLCPEHELPECPGGNNKKQVPSCQTYTMDNPIIPGETVQYPTSNDKNNGVKIELTSFLLGLPFFIMYI